MAKGYWLTIYHSVSNSAALAEYAKHAGPAIEAAGGRILARGVPSKTYEAGETQRVVVIEFDSVAAAIAAYESAPYQAAFRLLENGANREIRIVEGLN
jgi:uncharacterized protein (DUF1330 family)